MDALIEIAIHLSINSDEVFGDGETSMPTCVTLAANSLSLLPILLKFLIFCQQPLVFCQEFFCYLE